MRILVVEDEADIRELMALHLKRSGYLVDLAENGEEAVRMLSAGKFDLAVVDWMLPGLSGLDVCRAVAGRVPVLMVTARAEPADIVLGLETGADDYVTKPFELPVFVARVKALLRRRPQGGDEPLRLGPLSLDPAAHKVYLDSKELPLTPSEFKLLKALLLNRGKTLSRGQLVALVQGDGISVVDRTVDTHVFGLRKKLGAGADFIEAIRGVGYRIRPGDGP